MKTLVTVKNELTGKVIKKGYVFGTIDEVTEKTKSNYTNIKSSDFGSLLLTNESGTFRFTFK